MTIFGLWVCIPQPTLSRISHMLKPIQVINKAGGLVYERSFGGMSTIRSANFGELDELQQMDFPI